MMKSLETAADSEIQRYCQVLVNRHGICISTDRTENIASNIC
jgi:hypothetical protein